MASAIDAEVRLEIAALQLELKKRQWLAALRWRSRVKTSLASSGISFTEWLVLDTTWALSDRRGDSVTQDEVAKELELEALTLWHTLAVLEHQGLVCRARTLSGQAWRVFVTRAGVELLRSIGPALERASTLSS